MRALAPPMDERRPDFGITTTDTRSARAAKVICTILARGPARAGVLRRHLLDQRIARTTYNKVYAQLLQDHVITRAGAGAHTVYRLNK